MAGVRFPRQDELRRTLQLLLREKMKDADRVCNDADGEEKTNYSNVLKINLSFYKETHGGGEKMGGK